MYYETREIYALTPFTPTVFECRVFTHSARTMRDRPPRRCSRILSERFSKIVSSFITPRLKSAQGGREEGREDKRTTFIR
jgi:hypothetical protein